MNTAKERPDDGRPFLFAEHGRFTYGLGRMSRIRKELFRIVTRGENGEQRIKEYTSQNSLLAQYTQIGVDDCSTNLSLRGLPVFRGLIGPMTDADSVVRYESPDVFESMTKEWTTDGPHKKSRRRARRRSKYEGQRVTDRA